MADTAQEIQVISFPLDDTWFTARGLGVWHGGWTSGVFSDEDSMPKVTAAGGMDVHLSGGMLNLKRDKFWSVSSLVAEGGKITLDRAHTSLPRYDAICLRLNKNMEIPQVIYRAGTASSKPVIPPITRGGLDFDEVYPAAIYVRAGATQITAADIIPLQLNEQYCGLIRDGVQHIPSQQLWDMFMSWFRQTKNTGDTEVAALLEYGKNFRKENTDGMAAWRQQFENGEIKRANDFYTGFSSSNIQRADNFLTNWMAQNDVKTKHYFETIQNELSENQAINLANMIFNHTNHSIYSQNGLHGLRIWEGWMWYEKVVESGQWSKIQKMPEGWTFNYLKKMGYSWSFLKASNISFNDLKTLIEVEAV